MKQVVHTQRGGQVLVQDIPTPVLRPGTLLVRTAHSVISAGTERQKVEVARKNLLGKAMARPDQVRAVLDSASQIGIAATLQKVMSRLDALSPLGYSSSGIVIGVGAGCEGFAPGDRVACGGATAAHAEIVCVPKNLCVAVPDDVPLDEACFATVGAIALQGVRQSGAVLGETVGVIGLGLLGLLTVQLLRSAGCRVVGIDPDPYRRLLAQRFGADAAFDPDSPDALRISQHLSADGLDSVIITAATSSNAPVVLAGRLARDRATVVMVGAVPIDVPRSPYYEKELSVRLSRSYGPGRYDQDYEEHGHDYPVGYVRWTEGRNMQGVLDLLAQGKLDIKSLITSRFAISAAPEAYEHLEHGGPDTTLGVLLDYDLAKPADGQSAPIAVHSKRSPTNVVGIGLIGAGNFAQAMLLPHLQRQARVRLRAVATSTGLTARSVADRFKFEVCSSSAADVLADPEVRVAVVASRHDSHAELVTAALDAGKAVFVEKPLAITREQQQRVVDAYRGAADPFVMVGFNRRFQPLVVRLREFAAEAREPLLIHYRVNAGHIPLTHWTQARAIGGGRIIGEMCHFVDLVLYLMRSRPVEVVAHATPDAGRYNRDNVSALVRFSDGGVATITYAANGDRGLEKERIEVFGGGRAAALDDFRRLTLAFGGKQTKSSSGPDKGHRQEMESLVTAIAAGDGSPVPFEESVLAMDVTFAIEQSLDTGVAISI